MVSTWICPFDDGYKQLVKDFRACSDMLWMWIGQPATPETPFSDMLVDTREASAMCRHGVFRNRIIL
jgi:hypothetical protein